MRSWLCAASFGLLISSSGWAAVCEPQAKTPVNQYPDELTLQEHLKGTWIFCANETPGAAFYVGDHAGIEVIDGGKMFLLQRDASGALVRQWGFAGEYQSQVLFEPGYTPSFMWQIQDDMSGNALTLPRFSENFDTLRIMGDLGTTVYQKTTDTVIVPPVTDEGGRKGAAGCAQREAMVSNFAGSADDVRHLVRGTWWDCKTQASDEFIQPLLPDYALGIQFDSAGQWHYVVSPDGSLSTNPNDSGTYDMNKYEGTYRIVIRRANQEELSLTWSFSSAPVKGHFFGLIQSPNSWGLTEGHLSAMP